MVEWTQLENAVTGLLASLPHGAGALFATVTAGARVDRRQAVRQLAAARLPAALVTVDDRDRPDLTVGAPGHTRLTVLLADGNLRSLSGGRIGDVDSPGLFLVADQARTALSTTALDDTHRLVLIDEHVVAAEDHHVMLEQRWQARRIPAGNAPTFNGEPLPGDRHLLEIEHTPPATRVSDFRLPGIDGVFRHALGSTARRITVRGVLRAPDAAAVHAHAVDLELRAINPIAATFDSGDGRTFARCSVDLITFPRPVRLDPGSGDAIQPYELRFTQVGGPRPDDGVNR